MSGFMFGLIIGYLSWYAFRPSETQKTVPIQKIGALLAVIGGATVLTLFPSGSILFENYSVGLGVGFFFTPAKKWLTGFLKSAATFVERKRSFRSRKYKEEIQKIETSWIALERLLQHKLETSQRIDEREPRSNYIDIEDLQELQYSPDAIEYIMQRFAQLNVRDGIEYRVWDGKPTLFKKKW